MSGFLSIMGWGFLPNLVTGWTQSIYYSLTIRAGSPRPQPGTPRFAEHRRRIHIFVVSAYLLYTIYEADYDLRRAGSFYSDLGVPPSASDRDIKTRFRRLAATYHPDKMASATPADAARVNAYFVHLKTAADTLADPARRFAYDRLGPAIVRAAAVAKSQTVYAFVLQGLQDIVPYYVVAAACFYLLGMLGYMAWGRYERWLLLSSMLVFELAVLTRPAHPAFLTHVFNPVLQTVAAAAGHPRAPFVPFQLVQLARKLSVTSYLAFNQLGPLLGADTRSGQIVATDDTAADEKKVAATLALLETAAHSLDAEAGRLLELELAPFSGQPDALANVRGRVKAWLINNTIRSDPMVRDALGRSLQRRRADAPAGARGTR